MYTLYFICVLTFGKSLVLKQSLLIQPNTVLCWHTKYWNCSNTKVFPYLSPSFRNARESVFWTTTPLPHTHTQWLHSWHQQSLTAFAALRYHHNWLAVLCRVCHTLLPIKREEISRCYVWKFSQANSIICRLMTIVWNGRNCRPVCDSDAQVSLDDHCYQQLATFKPGFHSNAIACVACVA